ncbi:MAG: hypothetical protein ACYTG4_13105 [Planctomycetota bacterium]|jgi:hypothetical protein
MHKLTLAVLLLLSASPLQEIAEEPVAEATLQKQEIPAKRLDPSQYEVMLPAHGEWNASLVYENDVGVWTVGIHQVIPEYGCPEVIGLDDRGRCSVMASYSGKWTRYDLVGEGQWLGGLEQADLDPRAPGTEIYTGGRMGNLYQVVHERRGVFSTRLIAHIPGREIHTLVAGDLVPSREGNEMVLFTRPGGLFLVTCEEDGAFRLRDLGDAGGRVRDAVLLPSRPGDVPTIATVARTGTVRLLRLGAEGPEWSIVHRRTMGFGRIALRPESTPESVVFYTSCDDGLVLRHAGPASGPFSTKTIYAGPQGLRSARPSPRSATAARSSCSHGAETGGRLEPSSWIATRGTGSPPENWTVATGPWRSSAVATASGCSCCRVPRATASREWLWNRTARMCPSPGR